MRLLVNSRDELSLANVVCGPTGIVDEKDFTFIKNEAKKTKMPLFQVQKPSEYWTSLVFKWSKHVQLTNG